MSAVCVVMFCYICSKVYSISTVSILTACVLICAQESLIEDIYDLSGYVIIKQMYKHP